MVASNDDRMLEASSVTDFVEVLKEGEEVLFFAVVGEVTGVDEDVSFHV